MDNPLIRSIAVYISMVYILFELKPKVMFDQDGFERPLGVLDGETVMSVWLTSFLVGVMAYLS